MLGAILLHFGNILVLYCARRPSTYFEELGVEGEQAENFYRIFCPFCRIYQEARHQT